MTNLIKRLARYWAKPKRSKAWLHGWNDSAIGLEYKNTYAAGTKEHRDYTAGFEAGKDTGW